MSTRLQKLEKELESVKIELMVLTARSRKFVSGNLYSTEINKLVDRERNLHININQEKQKGL